MKIFYRDGYKYQLFADYIYNLPDYFVPTWHEIETDFLWYDGVKQLIVKQGYAWDGPSGPTWDTKNFLRGSLVHDSVYQLCREGFLEKNIHRPIADRLLYDLVREDGMNWFRAKYVYYAVRVAANPMARKQPKVILTAP
jgi:hypothetical protein